MKPLYQRIGIALFFVLLLGVSLLMNYSVEFSTVERIPSGSRQDGTQFVFGVQLLEYCGAPMQTLCQRAATPSDIVQCLRKHREQLSSNCELVLEQIDPAF